MIHNTRPDLGEEVWGGCEETTTGVIRLRAMERQGILKFPMVAVNDAQAIGNYVRDCRVVTFEWFEKIAWLEIIENKNTKHTNKKKFKMHKC